eukprot:m.16951 g.16951  ORF g.16951 m.16951 type:complete len:888 (+) comp5856_c0_seq1:231-2894(+)
MEESEVRVMKQWLKTEVSRTDAEEALKGKRDGCFLVRRSKTDPGSYAISLSLNGSVQHHIIRHNNDRMVTKSGRPISNLEELIAYYKNYSDGLPCLLTSICPIPTATDDLPVSIMGARSLPTSGVGKSKRHKMRLPPPPEDDDSDDGEDYYVATISKLSNHEIPRERLQLFSRLGSGQFGEVYEGWMATPNGMGTLVAVKMLKEPCTKQDTKAFLEEATTLIRFKHPNVLKLLGIVTVTAPLLIVTEYMVYGDLKSVLRAARHLYIPVGHYEMVHFANEIVTGMAHLSSLNFVHRDLAARNVLVGNDNAIKIGDFGLSRKVEGEYYRVRQHVLLPIKWMAPESIDYRTFSSASDVWAFGVVLYEIAALGRTPYKKMDNREVAERVTEGFRLTAPEGSPPSFSSLMKKCWQHTPEDRPSFLTLANSISVLRSSYIPADGSHPLDIAAAVKEATESELDKEDLDPYNRLAVELSTDDFRFIRDLGEGKFGCVSLMELKRDITDNNNGTDLVAVKMLRNDAPESAENEFQDEMDNLEKLSLNHPNIIKLIGFVTKSKPLMIVMEYLSYGDLKSYLSRVYSKCTTSEELQQMFSSENMVKVTTDIASGCEYLTSKQIIHRDLAARNILAGPGPEAKVSDFGLGKLTETGSYYAKEGQRPVPIRWMAPEAFLYGKFSEKSDVFAFGVVIYEIVTYGAIPYYEQTNMELSENLQKGKAIRLECPPEAPNSLVPVMEQCLLENMDARPTFAALKRIVSKLYVESEGDDESTRARVGTGKKGGPLPPLIKAGWVTKQGGGSKTFGKTNWKKRWFELREDKIIRYYKNEKSGDSVDKPVGEINLVDGPWQARNMHFCPHPAGCCFAITTPARMFACVVKDMLERDAWIATLKALQS